MASLFKSSLTAPLQRASSISSLHARSSSSLFSCQASEKSLSQFLGQSATIHSLSRTQVQSRSITTHIQKPFSKSKSSLKPSSSTRGATAHNLSAEEISPAPRPALPLTNLPYFVRRTPSNQLPVYLLTKSGGTRQETKLQKTEGDVDALREDLIKALGMEQNPSDVVINRLNGHINVKGWRKPEILQFLLDRKF